MVTSRAAMLWLVLVTGCATGPPPFRYQPPTSVRAADREYCHALASAAAQETYARYGAIMGTDPLGRRSGRTFGGIALAEHAWEERERVYAERMRTCLSGKGYSE